MSETNSNEPLDGTSGAGNGDINDGRGTYAH